MSTSRDQSQQILVPAAVFSDRGLSFSEALINYLWAGHRLSPSQIGRLLAMDRRNVWTIMSRISRKSPQELPRQSDVFLPVELFAGRTESLLETVVAYLREEQGMTNKQAAVLLSRSEKTVWTAYSRHKARRGEGK